GPVAVSDPKPRLAAELLQSPERLERVAAHAPSRLGVGEPGERVDDGVEIGTDVKSMPLEVVSGVDHDRDVARRDDLDEPGEELRRPDASGERGNPHRFLTTPGPGRAPLFACSGG